MTENEIKLLTDSLNNCNSYLEYGSGNSTKISSTIDSISKIICVESDGKYLDEEVRSDEAVSSRESRGEITYITPNLGDTEFWGHIANTAHRQNWPIYALGPYLNKDFEKPDLVLVDGRFRVACVLAAILNLGSDARVLVHDFTWRKKYHRVLKFCEKVEEVDTLVVLKAKKDFNRNDAQKMFQKFVFNPIDSTKSERFLKKIVKTVLGEKRAKKIAHGGTREV